MIGYEINKAIMCDVIKKSIDKLYLIDGFLIKNDVHEQAISHRLAIYLEEEIREIVNTPDLSVDCEYDRCFNDEKFLNRYEKSINIKNWIKILCQQNEIDKIVRPDIIIHHRGEQCYNLCVVELKKKNCSQKDMNWVDIKLKALTDEKGGFRYRYGFAIEISVDKASITVYRNGSLEATYIISEK